MLTVSRQSAEEELALAELALADLLEAAPVETNAELIGLESKQATEMAQCVARGQALLQARYDQHRIALSELKAKHAQEISELFASNRESKFNLASLHAQIQSEVKARAQATKAEYAVAVKQARQRVRNAEIALRHLSKVGK